MHIRSPRCPSTRVRPSTYTATAVDTYGRTASDTVNVSLPSTINFSYAGNGNLTSDGRRVFEYDYENQLTNVYVASAWRSEFKYDAFERRKVRKEYTWQSSAWLLTNEVRYVYEGMLVVQERDGSNVPQVSYTRGSGRGVLLRLPRPLQPRADVQSRNGKSQ